jgi:hypothetical protein
MDLPYYERNITQLNWNVLVSSAVFGLDAIWCIDGGLHHMWTVGLSKWDVPTHINIFNQMMDFLDEYPVANSSSYWIEFFPTEAVLAVPDDETAYPHRDINAHV